MTGVETGDCRNTCTGDPKDGEGSGESSSLARLPLPDRILGRGFGWFLPGKVLGLMPGDVSLRLGRETIRHCYVMNVL